MTVDKISDNIQPANAEGQTSSCIPLFKPDTITDNCDGNIIPFTNAAKLQRQLITNKLNDEKFNYPMLECS